MASFHFIDSITVEGTSLLFCKVIWDGAKASVSLSLFHITKHWIHRTKTKTALKIQKDVLVLISAHFLTEVSHTHTHEEREASSVLQRNTRSQSATGTLEVMCTRFCVYARDGVQMFTHVSVGVNLWVHLNEAFPLCPRISAGCMSCVYYSST